MTQNFPLKSFELLIFHLKYQIIQQSKQQPHFPWTNRDYIQNFFRKSNSVRRFEWTAFAACLFLSNLMFLDVNVSWIHITKIWFNRFDCTCEKIELFYRFNHKIVKFFLFNSISAPNVQFCIRICEKRQVQKFQITKICVWWSMIIWNIAE